MSLSWHCIGHNPTRWGLGEFIEEYNQLAYLVATIERLKSGQWAVMIPNHYCLHQPSRIEAMKEVEREFCDKCCISEGFILEKGKNIHTQ